MARCWQEEENPWHIVGLKRENLGTSLLGREKTWEHRWQEEEKPRHVAGRKRKTWARHWYQGTDVASRKRKILGTSLVGKGKHGHVAVRKRKNMGT